MFQRKGKSDNKELTLVGSNSRIDGDINFSGRCHVDGTVNGNIRADLESESLLTVVGDGTVEGGVRVPYIELNGIVRGDVVASRHVKLGSSARVIGNVYYNLIEMAIGAEINGKLIHQPEGKVPLLEQKKTVIGAAAKIASAT
ncbi:MAG: polymer-forming cytoskeletal protein [Proteobacteria bacterium]|nr:polymer-forming cytoskeletal protein [Pseudomonadota bacterium]MDA0995026.1 polymer-forming cytoskeletal protein [Pseudomonadota bacterium]